MGPENPGSGGPAHKSFLKFSDTTFHFYYYMNVYVSYKMEKNAFNLNRTTHGQSFRKNHTSRAAEKLSLLFLYPGVACGIYITFLPFIVHFRS